MQEFIEEEMTEFPKFHFFIMGILDLLHVSHFVHELLLLLL